MQQQCTFALPQCISECTSSSSSRSSTRHCCSQQCQYWCCAGSEGSPLSSPSEDSARCTMSGTSTIHPTPLTSTAGQVTAWDAASAQKHPQPGCQYTSWASTAKQKQNSTAQAQNKHKPWSPWSSVMYSRTGSRSLRSPPRQPSSLRQHLTAAIAALMLLLTLGPSSLNLHLVSAQTASSCKRCGPVSSPPPPPAGGTCNPAPTCTPSQSLSTAAGDPVGPPAVFFRGYLNSSTPAGASSSTAAGVASLVSLVGVPLQYTGPLTSWVACYSSLSGALTLNSTTKLAPIGNTVLPGVTAYITPGSPFSATSGGLNSNGLTARSLNVSFGQGPDASGVPKMSGAGVRAVAFEFSSKPSYGSLRTMVRLCGVPGSTTAGGGQQYGQYSNAGGPVPMPGLGPLVSTTAGSTGTPSGVATGWSFWRISTGPAWQDLIG
jgi:hypothetical protein